MAIKNPKCIDGDNVHQDLGDNLIVVSQFDLDLICNVTAVIRWCKICGAVVADKEVDGRLQAGAILKMSFPSYLRDRFSK